MITIKPTFFENEWLKRIKTSQKKEFQRIGNWIVAGSGNYEKYQIDGRYRENCNTFREASTCEVHRIKSLKLYYNHCKKLDCETCFIHASSHRARIINHKLLEFKEKAEKERINVGRIAHVILSPKLNQILPHLYTYEDFLGYRKELEVMLEDYGLFAGVIMFDLWSLRCENCVQKERNCTCNNKNIKRMINPHFHFVGFGYLRNSEELRLKYDNWVIINAGRRDDGYHTIMYVLSHVALWRKDNGKLKPAYIYFGWLQGTKLIPVKQIVKFIPEKCKICKRPHKRILNGVKISGENPRLGSNLTLIEMAKKLGIKTEKITAKSIERALEETVYNNEKIKIELSTTDLKFGNEISYKYVIKKYQIEDIGKLRQIVRINRKIFEYEKIKSVRKRKNESNGFG